MKHAMKRRQNLIALATSASVLAGQGYAFEAADLMAFKAGPVLIRPHMSVAERYDDNILLQKSGPFKESDLITFINPSVTLTLGRKEVNNPFFNFASAEENYLSLRYDFNQYFYASHADLSGSDHMIDFSNRLKGNRLSLEGSDQVNMLNSVLGQGYGLNQAISRTYYNNSYRLSYLISDKTSAYVVGSHNSEDYQKGLNLFDNNTLRGTFGFAYKIRPKTSLFGEVYYGQAAVNPNIAIPKGPHETFVGGFLGARGDFTSKLSGSIKAGYETREFSDNRPAGASPVVDASISYRYSEKTSASLSYSRTGSVSVQSPGVIADIDNVNLNLNQRFGAAGKLMAGLNVGYGIYDYGSSTLVYYTTTGQRFTSPYARADDYFHAGVNLTYVIKVWLNTGLGYEFQKFSSTDHNVIDYTVNRVTLTVAVGY